MSNRSDDSGSQKRKKNVAKADASRVDTTRPNIFNQLFITPDEQLRVLVRVKNFKHFAILVSIVGGYCGNSRIAYNRERFG